MSRVGKKEILLPNGVEVSRRESLASFKGPLGTIEIEIPSVLEFFVEEGKCYLRSKSRDVYAIWGTVASNLKNAVFGVSNGFQKVLNLVGVGYKVQKVGKDLDFSLGYSHNILFEVEEGVEATVSKPTQIVLKGRSKELVGMVASKIAALRKVEPYKGKGVLIEGKFVLRKEGKKK